MEIRFRGAHEVSLAGHAEGDPAAPPVLLLHGGGQTRHAWSGTAVRLAAAGFYAIAVDLRGHGESSWAGAAGYSIDGFAADVREIVPQLQGARATRRNRRRVPRSEPQASEAEGEGAPALVGASLGGLASLLAVGEEPRVPCSALVLVDVAPRMEAAGRDKIGQFMRARPEGFASLEEAADAVAAFLPHRPRPSDPSGLAKNLRLHADGRYRWHWDPDFMSGRLGFDASAPDRFEAAARSLRIPTLLVRGGISDVVSKEGVRAFLEVLPSAESVDVADAGHMVAGDQNDPFSDAVIGFLSRARGTAR